MICTNNLFTSDQWIVFNKYGIQVPIEGERYTIRETIETRKGKAFLLNEIRNPKIPNETPDPEGTDLYFEPSFAAWRFKEESKILENTLEISEAA